ncbi:hypothetical protein [Microbulbifer pacificus]|uniref:Uncharacterized protein n=1 Tax=Microbulbifer pacificus TaxID=407164 RepID=A0AAU0MYG6_9GAMM|nr:hypothetical protein [Microbulbifer pacificus]WOX05053.1 hypothetical protein R5R33_15090 [Microbulbifer pacificus]
MFFPKRIETEEEVIVRSNLYGFAIGFLFANASYFLQDASFSGVSAEFVKTAEVVFMLLGYAILGRYIYLVYVNTSDIRKAAKKGLNIRVSGSPFSIKNPVEHRYLKSELRASIDK